MPRELRPYEPDQGRLLPPSLRDWLPEDHLAFFISDAIDALDLSAFEARYGSATRIATENDDRFCSCLTATEREILARILQKTVRLNGASDFAVE
jgi:hypothetical protein